MNNFINDIILETDPNYSVISVDHPFELDSFRYDDIYSYIANLDNFLETREEDIDIIPLSKLDNSGEKNSVLMSSDGELKWQQISKKIEPNIAVSSTYDETFLYQGINTMILGNFRWVDNMSVVSTKIIPSPTGGQLTTSLLLQDSSDDEWVKLRAYITTENEKFTATSQTQSGDSYSLTFETEKDNFDILGCDIIDTNGTVAKVQSLDNLVTHERDNDVIKSVSSTRYSISVIKEDGSVYNWGQIGTADRLPPVDVGNFRQVDGSYYCHIGLTDEGQIYGWGYSSYTARKIMDYAPSTNNFIYVCVGFDFGLAITDTHDLYHWGSSTRVNPDLLPSRYTTVTDGKDDKSADDFIKVVGSYKVGGALRRDGRLHIFGAADFYNLINDAPTYDDIIDFDFTYKSGVYLRANGEVGQWGSFYYPIPDFQGKTIIKVIGGKYIHQAVSSDGYLFTWGSSSLTSVAGSYRTGVRDSTSYDYIGVYVQDDMTVRPFTKVSTLSPQAEVNNNAPSPTSFFTRASGNVIEGYTRSYLIDTQLTTNTFYISTARLGYHIYNSDYRDEQYFTFFDVESYNLIGNDTIEVNYKEVEINTSKLTFYYSTKTNYEISNRLQFDVDKKIIGE